MIRRICEKYMCLPSEVEELTLNQVLLLVVPEKRLEKLGGQRRTSVGELQREGVIPLTGGGSLVQRLRAKMRAEKEQAGREGRRQRRQERIARLIEYKKQAETEDP